MLTLLAACPSKLKKGIIGEWSEIGGTERLEILKDGSISLNSMYMRASGSYKFLEKDKLSLEFANASDDLKGPFVAQVSIIDNILILTMPNGRISKYERVK
jgi:hypothetical protein